MIWEIDFEARPFKLAVRRVSGGSAKRRATKFSPFALPDSLYRMAARRVLYRLAMENRQLRHWPRRHPNRVTAAIAMAVERWARRKWPEGS